MRLDERHFFVAGLVLCLAAVGIGLSTGLYLPAGAAPNVAATGASIGLAVAGGLAFLAAARHNRRGPGG